MGMGWGQGQDPEAEPLAAFRQPIEIRPAVFIIAKGRLPLVPSNDDLVDRLRAFQPGGGASPTHLPITLLLGIPLLQFGRD
jgi:hypothetical protein